MVCMACGRFLYYISTLTAEPDDTPMWRDTGCEICRPIVEAVHKNQTSTLESEA